MMVIHHQLLCLVLMHDGPNCKLGTAAAVCAPTVKCSHCQAHQLFNAVDGGGHLEGYEATAKASYLHAARVNVG